MSRNHFDARIHVRATKISTGEVVADQTYETTTALAQLLLKQLGQMVADFPKTRVHLSQISRKDGATVVDIEILPMPPVNPSFEERYRRDLPTHELSGDKNP
ncbi:MAG: hypothetical protein BroJett011_42730 [Chloroflexota bacterium]|nr:MAG: hypothetical protein BroJett011_42730 [Chloroflexota bacterium]